MAFIYSEFDTTPANLIADLKAKILTSSDYSNPTGQVVRATTPLGATIAVDLLGLGAPDTQRMRPYYYRSFPGTGPGVDSYQQSLYYRQQAAAGGSTAEPLHCKVSAGNTLLYVEIEGPRNAEAGAESTSIGSVRQAFFVSQLTPYFAGDTVPAVVAGGPSSWQSNETGQPNGSPTPCFAYVSRNQLNTQSWASAILNTLGFPNAYGPALNWGYTAVASDGNDYLMPYVAMEQVAGMRGRLTDLFFAGWNAGPQAINNQMDMSTGYKIGDVVNYGGNTYKITAPYKSVTNNWQSYGALGAYNNGANGAWYGSPLVAVRTA